MQITKCYQLGLSLLLSIIAFTGFSFGISPMGAYINAGVGMTQVNYKSNADLALDHRYPGAYQDNLYRGDKDSYHTSLYNIGAGYRFGLTQHLNMHLGLDYLYLTNFTNKGKVYLNQVSSAHYLYDYQYKTGAQALFANVAFYYDIANLGALTHIAPFINLEAGAASVKNSAQKFIDMNEVTPPSYQFKDKTTTNFAYNVSLGISTIVAKHNQLALAVSYMDLGKSRLGDANAPIATHAPQQKLSGDSALTSIAVSLQYHYLF